MDYHYEEWSTNAPRGLLLIGAGVSIVGQAIVLKAQRKAGWKWFLMGFVGLVAAQFGRLDLRRGGQAPHALREQARLVRRRFGAAHSKLWEPGSARLLFCRTDAPVKQVKFASLIWN